MIDLAVASVHIPFFLDGAATCSYRGAAYIDGSLWDFLLSDNSELIKCGGEACVVDYVSGGARFWERHASMLSCCFVVTSWMPPLWPGCLLPPASWAARCP